MKLAVMMVVCVTISTASLYGIFSKGEAAQYYIKEVINENALNSLIRSNAYVVVQFLNPGCQTCGAFRDAATYTHLAKNLHNVIFVEVDIAKIPRLKEKWNILRTPTFLLFENGQNLEEFRFESRPTYSLFKEHIIRAFGLKSKATELHMNIMAMILHEKDHGFRGIF